MNHKLSILKMFSLSLSLLLTCADAQAAVVTNNIPVAGNSWVVNFVPANNDFISHKGTMKWENPASVIRTYFKTTQAGDITLSVRAKVFEGTSKIRFAFDGKSRSTTMDNTELELIPLGTLKNVSPGYHYLEMQGQAKQGKAFAEMTDLVVFSAQNNELFFVKDEFYWGRRGPSVHLNLKLPADTGDVLYHYSEITVPEGNDILGSYYMANGFNGGYFGIQANSETERRILFSVWSPFKTDNPREIPEDFRVKMLKKGESVHVGEFGNEGSGGQSYRKYFWKTGVTYGFLLKGEPSENDSTDFTAWFFAPEIGQWELIASFRKPKGSSYLKHHHSFLENFRTESGCLPRKVYYSNQWLYSIDERWREITEFTFSCDNTGRKKNRLDFTGGSEGKRFFLKNCGFFDADVQPGTRFTRKPTDTPPRINFLKLP